MSGPFGVSAGDAFAIGNFAWQLYKSCKAAPSEFKEVSREVASLHTSLKEVSDEVSNPTSVLGRFGPEKRAELDEILHNCRVSLMILEALLKKHASLGSSSKKFWDRLRFDAKEIQQLREKLVFYKASINLFLTTHETRSLGTIEKRLDELVEEIRNGRRQSSTLVVTDPNDDDVVSWNTVNFDLQSFGFTKEDIETHRNGIQAYLLEMVENLRLASDPEEDSVAMDSLRKSIFPVHVPPISAAEDHKRILTPSIERNGPGAAPSSPLPTGRRRQSFVVSEVYSELQEYDGQGRLRKRTITRQSSNSSLGSHYANTNYRNHSSESLSARSRSSFISPSTPSNVFHVRSASSDAARQQLPYWLNDEQLDCRSERIHAPVSDDYRVLGNQHEDQRQRRLERRRQHEPDLTIQDLDNENNRLQRQIDYLRRLVLELGGKLDF